MAFIYKITNLINNKVQIGQTRTRFSERMSKHFSNAKIKENPTGIDGAIRKYGKENFLAEIIEECPIEDLDERERQWIDYQSSYTNGYNLTLGGQDGLGTTIIFNKEEVEKALQEQGTINGAAKVLGCCNKTLSNYMRENDIKTPFVNKGKPENFILYPSPNTYKEGDGAKKVYCKELDMTFSSLKECAQYLVDNGYSKASTMDLARKSLSRCLTGSRTTYLGMHFTQA